MKDKTSQQGNEGIMTEATLLPTLSTSNKGNDKSKGTALVSNFLSLCSGMQIAYGKGHSTETSLRHPGC